MFKSSLTVFSAFILLFIFPLLTFGDSIGSQNAKENVATKVSLEFSVNHTMAHANAPFLALCIVKNFADHEKKNYSVIFYKTSDNDEHPIGQFDVIAPTASHPKQRMLFENIVQKQNLGKVTLTPALTTLSYPNFSVIVKPENIFKHENYWCELVEPASNPSGHKYVASSNLWVNTPILTLYVERVHGSENDYIASCWIDHFDLQAFSTGEGHPALPGRHINSTTVSFEVHFFIDSYNIGSFNVTPNALEVFTPRQAPEDSEWTVIGSGPNVEYPIFDVRYKNYANKRKTFQCMLLWDGLTADSPGGNVRSNLHFSN